MESKHKNALIGGLLAIVFIMAVGFAGFTQQLTIEDTATVSSNWNIGFSAASTTSECPETPTAACGEITSFTAGATSISFATTLFSPGDTVTYNVTVKNSGNVDAKLTSVSLVEDNDDNLIRYSQTGLTANSTTVAANNGEVSFTVVVTFEQTSGAIAAQSDGLTMNLTWEEA